MASSPTQDQGRTARDQVGQTGNTAACGGKAAVLTADSKQTDAVSQAIQLGSGTSWSDAFSPQPYLDRMAEQHLVAEDTHRETPNDLPDITGPPPTYANALLEREMPTSSMQDNHRENAMEHDEEQREMYGLGHRSAPASLQEPDAFTPLLGTSIHTAGDSPSSWWLPEQKTTSRRKLCYIACLITLIIMLTIGGCVAFLHRDILFKHTPPLPTATYVPTDRIYERHETVGDITGGYKLYDRLSLSTTTGNIDIELDPQPGTESALLFLASDLGSVTVHLANKYITDRKRPQRAILTELHTFAGYIVAELPLGWGGSIEVHTSVGHQTINIFVDGATLKHPISNITTVSSTGDQHIRLTPMTTTAQSGKSISAIRAEHHSLMTGHLKMTYPDTWLGIVDARAGVGNLDITGDDLTYSEQQDFYTRARRGRDIDDNIIHIISDGTGSISFQC